MIDRIHLDQKRNDFFRNVHASIPKDIGLRDEWLELAFEHGMISRENLEPGKYYFGRCRNADVARWNAEGVFTYVRTKFGSKFSEEINHPEDDNGYDLFIPIGEVAPEVGEIINDDDYKRRV